MCKVLAPDQTVVPMRVSEILVIIPFIRLRRIVFSRRCRVGGDDDRALIEIKLDVALQPNGRGEIVSGRKENGPAAGGCRLLDRFVNRVAVELFAVTLGAKSADV